MLVQQAMQECGSEASYHPEGPRQSRDARFVECTSSDAVREIACGILRRVHGGAGAPLGACAGT